MIARIEGMMNEMAGRLHSSRVDASVRFSEAITASVRNLELPYAVFEAEVADAPMSASGSDTVMFRFSSTGKNAVDVAKCASGGEKSRIMLALKAMMGEKAQIGECHGTAMHNAQGYTVFALYHPASLIYNRSLESVYEADVRTLAQQLAAR